MNDLAVVCPVCGQVNDQHWDPKGSAARPEPGDVSVCWACASPSIFTADLTLRHPSLAETVAILAATEGS